MTAVNILLFDVDGVLVEPRAYRVCIGTTLEILFKEIGIFQRAKFLPTEADIAYFEAHGVHDVWDIANIIFAMVQVASSQVRSMKELTVPDYKAFVDRMSGGAHILQPPEVALALLSEDLRTKLGSDDASDWIERLAAFLPQSRSAYGSRVTRLFQNILLGSAAFQSTYGLASEYDGKPLLQSEDRVLLTPSSAARVCALQKDFGWKVAVYTGRPSGAPAFVGEPPKGFSPEAEAAAELAGMNDFPLVAAGTMEWLAARMNSAPENLTKPNLTQAYAAFLCALNQDVTEELLLHAYTFGTSQAQADNLLSADGAGIQITVNVFEDTASGIIPMIEVAERLSRTGFQIQLNCLGISNDEAKRSSLANYCPQVFADVNQALDFVIAHTPAPQLEGIGGAG